MDAAVDLQPNCRRSPDSTYRDDHAHLPECRPAQYGLSPAGNLARAGPVENLSVRALFFVMNLPSLTETQIAAFVTDGFVRIEHAFARQSAEAARRILWRETGCDPSNPGSWTKPVIRLGDYGGSVFAEMVNTTILHGAFDQLAGKGRWLPRTSLGTFPIRFPSPIDPGDTGWHIDTSFPGVESSPDDFLSWRANINSRGRALLMLFLLSDVAENDAPTRIRAGSHIDIARRLAPQGEAGLSLRELAINNFAESANRPEELATGEAGTVYLCHPFLVHAAQPNRGTQPRFMAQPPLLPQGLLCLTRSDRAYSPVEQAIRLALVGLEMEAAD
jgi:hypothetical protein